jgi:hypothetical protein
MILKCLRVRTATRRCLEMFARSNGHEALSTTPLAGSPNGRDASRQGTSQAPRAKALGPLGSPSMREGSLRTKEASRRLTRGRPHSCKQPLAVKHQTMATVSGSNLRRCRRPPRRQGGVQQRHDRGNIHPVYRR